MRAVVQSRYGPPAKVLQVQDVARPVPGPGQVLVHVRAASLHPDVWHAVTGRPWVLRIMGAGLFRPRGKIPGIDLAGRVDAVGDGVTAFALGDDVYGEVVTMQWKNGGTFAEYAAVDVDLLERMPAGITYEVAASVPTSGLIAYRTVMKDAAVKARQRVLINGAAGGVGMFCVQLCKALGAHVTAVDAASKKAMMERLGADTVWAHEEIDYTQTDVRYDAVIDIPGNHPYTRIRRVLKPKGLYVLVGHDGYGTNAGRIVGSMAKFFGIMLRARQDGHLPKVDFSDTNEGRLARLSAMLEDGRLEPVIDSVYGLDEIHQAMARLVSGDAAGKIVVRVAP